MSAVPHGDQQFGSIAETVRKAAAAPEPRRVTGGFSLTRESSTHLTIAALLGLYLGWAVARLPEVFPALAVPRLPMLLMLLFLLVLGVSLTFEHWKLVWQNSRPLNLVAALVVLSIITAPMGIWVMGSIDAVINRYSIAVVVFLACLVFFRDRRGLRAGATLYVMCVVVIAIYTFATYQPDAMLMDADGELISMAEAGLTTRRISVGISLDPNDWGAVLVTTIPIALWLSYGSFSRRMLWGAVALLLAAAIVPTASRGSLLGLVAVGLTLIMVGATGWRRFLLVAVVLAGGLVFSLIATEGQLSRFLDFGTDDYNLTNEGRIYFWRQGLVWMIKRPWGYGLNNYPTYFGWLNGPDRAAHSSWVQYGVELGVLGLVTFIALVVTLWRGNSANRRTAIALRSTFGRQADAEAVLSGHVMAMLAGTLLTGSFLSNAYYPLMYMALGIAAAAQLGFPFRETAAPPGHGLPQQRGPDATRGVVRRRRPSTART
ncbi:MAG TPA: O-antigen ligase family protein [Gemmatimonadales bacterium]|nr:O-antigen ligase family protein [Gemmatimonadales bacterium]